MDWYFEPSDNALLLSINDTGPGIDPVLLGPILEGATVLSTKKGGSGIGMLTVVSMLRRIGANLSAVCPPGKGMQWSIIVPSINEAETDDGLNQAEKREA